MGCCVSSNTDPRASASKKLVGSDDEVISSKRKGYFSHESRAPPPPVEEETVKEVLSETPKPKPKPKPVPHPEPVFTSEVKQDLKEEKEIKISAAHKVEAFAKIQEKQNLVSSSNEEIMSEVSEICSESVSTVTNVTDNKRENNEEEEEEEQEEVRPRQRLMMISRSPPAKPAPRNGFKRDQVVNQSPARRSDQSPARRTGNGSVRLVQNQEVVGRVKGPGRRDQGESSGRRSRSPATTRSSAAMRANRSPGRVRSEHIENPNGTGINSSGKMEAKKRAGNNNNNDNNNIDNDICSTNESLENPLVSLECFIFL